MTAWLIDTDILSATSPWADPPEHVAAWLREHDKAIWISTVSIAEVVRGAEKLRRTGATRRARELETWLARVIHLYERVILPLDLPIGTLTGQFLDRATGAGHDPGSADMAIAATAVHHGLTLATRNVKHFRPLGIVLFDPFAEIAPL